MKPRLQEKYEQEVRKALTEKRGYGNVHQVPKLEKIVINMGVPTSKEKGALEEAVKDLTAITGRKPVIVTTFSSFRQASQFGHGMWSNGSQQSGEHTATGEIIEGQVIEVRDDTALTHSPEKDKKSD